MPTKQIHPALSASMGASKGNLSHADSHLNVPVKPLIIADSGIPGILEALAPYGSVRLMTPANMSLASVRHSDILIVRSVLPVGKELLDGSRIRLVGSATAGTDHVDLGYLNQQGIAFSSAPGANSDSVADYVVASLLLLSHRAGRSLEGMCLGVVGCGEVGSRVGRRAAALGMRVLLNDPPIARAGSDFRYLPLQTLLDECDVITLHVPLTRNGPDRTGHLLGLPELSAFRGWLINTARGEVVDGLALARLRSNGRGPARVVLDVWENEPAPLRALVDLVDIGTGHIAGYARDSKFAATRAMRNAVSAFLGVSPAKEAEALLEVKLTLPAVSTEGFDWLTQAALVMCPLLRDDRALRDAVSALDPRSAFQAQRMGYPERRLMSRHVIEQDEVPVGMLDRVRDALGVRLLPPT